MRLVEERFEGHGVIFAAHLYAASRGVVEASPVVPGGIMYLAEKSFRQLETRRR